MQSELKEILTNSKGEREVASFLAKHPELLRWAVCRTGGHTTYIIKEVPLGSKYRADFVVAFSYSGAWEVHMIELEPPDDMVITKEGLPSHRLNKAISQVNEWEEYIKINPLSFRSDLSDLCIKKDLLGLHKSLKVPMNFTGHRLNAPDTYISYSYHIIIGNRDNIDSEKRKRMNQLRKYGLEIFTYGRLVDIAGNIDFHNANPRESVVITESEE